MSRTVAIGNQRFEELIKRNFFYIDKTQLIEEWWENGDQVTLITRPRRFGKTLNMDMMERFFSVKYKENTYNPFEKLSVWQNEELREQYCHHPVIFISFAGIKSQSFDGMRKALSQLLCELYEDYRFAFQSDKVGDKDRNFFERVSYDMEISDLVVSLRMLSRVLSIYYDRNVIILLDEYDTPMQEAWVSRYWDEAVDFIRELFNNTFKTNRYLYRALMTGITHVSIESIFSDFNNPKIATIFSDKYAEMFGFTQSEVDAALEEYNIEDPEQVRFWYDGFTIGNHTDIYNPWSISNFLSERKYSTYWANTSSNGLVSSLLRQGDTGIKDRLETLLRGECIDVPVTDELVFNQVDRNPNTVWSLLLCSGYIKKTGNGSRRNTRKLTITNYETRLMFEQMVIDWFEENQTDRDHFIDYLISGNVKMMNHFLSKITRNVFSYFDVGNGTNSEKYENFYHGFAIGLIVDLKEDYNITSNREAGLGRYDLCLCKKDLSQGIILEFKAVHEEKGESLESAATDALSQIKTKDYARSLISAGVPPENISQYGFAFQGKEVLICRNREVE